MSPVTRPLPAHLYVHIPFCSGKCLYCSFYTLPLTTANLDAYVDTLIWELQAAVERSGKPRLETIFFGGGTPSVLAPSQIERLGNGIRSLCDLDALQEWTFEGNPGHFSGDKLTALREIGVTRISMGAQALDDESLKRLGRRHTVNDLTESLRAIQTAGFVDTSIDLISAIPWISTDEWMRTLDRVVELNTTHLSVYNLTVEPDTALEHDIRKGKIRLLSETAQSRITRLTEDKLADAGFDRYEISNYAKPGHECRHNRAFWRGGDYLGIGPSAASRLGRLRRTNAANIQHYLQAARDQVAVPAEEETVDSVTDKRERLAFRFRLAEGLRQDEALHPFVPIMQDFRRRGIVTHRSGTWKLTQRGREVADTVAAHILTG